MQLARTLKAAKDDGEPAPGTPTVEQCDNVQTVKECLEMLLDTLKEVLPPTMRYVPPRGRGPGRGAEGEAGRSRSRGSRTEGDIRPGAWDTH
eukprot:4844794-Alexandrium_andersonii.AAC.1